MDELNTKIDSISNMLQSLSKATAVGFEEVHRRVDEVDKRLGQMDMRFEELGQKVNRNKLELLGKLAPRRVVDELHVKVKKLEEQIS